MPAATHRSAGLAELPRTQIEITGRDRVTFLHGMCTNDIKRLSPNDSCEAFLTNVQGKTIGYVYVHCRADSLVLETAANQAETLISHLDRYLIREDVQLHDRSEEWSTLLLLGAAPEPIASAAGWPLPPELPSNIDFSSNTDVDQNGLAGSIRRTGFAGLESLTLSVSTDRLAEVRSRLLGAGAAEESADVLEVRRVATGTPLFGIDVSPENLPQEVGRDERAISFTKGCYLGQETVARLDALGHVNKRLVGLALQAEQIPARNSVLTIEGKPVARITSACYSPTRGQPIAMAYVRRAHSDLGTEVQTDQGTATVIAFET